MIKQSDFSGYPEPVLRHGANLHAKQCVETIASILLVLALSPVLLIVAIAVKLTSQGPLFYKQKRVGLNGRQFEIIKFRTMYVGADRRGPSVTKAGDPRITPIGGFLRKWKLDEIPQLFNVIRGDMSLVGPRPQVPKFVAHFDMKYKDLVLSVRPGVTGPTSLVFRHEEQMLENVDDQETYYIAEILPVKLEMDAWYVQTRSIGKDAAIVGVTIWVLSRPLFGAFQKRFSFSSGKGLRNDTSQANISRVMDRFLPAHLVGAPPLLHSARDEQPVA